MPPSGRPSASVTVTVAPGSALPETVKVCGSIIAVGALGGVMSGAARLMGFDPLPAGSVCATVIVPPLFCGVVSVTV